VSIENKIVDTLPRLRKFAYGLTGSIEKGDDLVQSTCVRAIEKSSQWQVGTKFDSWMFRIAKNIFTDSWRKQKVKDRVLEQIKQESDKRLEHDQLDNYVTFCEVREAMNCLSEKHKIILMLVCVEGYSYQESSEILNIPVGTVASRVVRARNALLVEANMSGG
jgi:RNA polymerase sigma-70 factor (ECF subfamily)